MTDLYRNMITAGIIDPDEMPDENEMAKKFAWIDGFVAGIRFASDETKATGRQDRA